METHEAICNLHAHTPYSDGEAYHAQIAGAAMDAGLDMVCVTDHNVWVQGPERYYEADGRRVLLLVGEEIHDPARRPQKNHLLVYGADRELAPLAPRPQALLDAAHDAGALSFLAHPFDTSVPLFDYENISWVDWDVSGYTGLEIWNYMSDWARLLTSRQAAIRYAFNPALGVQGPTAETLAKWDALTASGRRVVGIGNADAHGTPVSMWGLSRVIFPYEFLFRQVNTHVLTAAPLTGEASTDRRLLLEALAEGRCFVGYDGAAPTRGFRVTASAESGPAPMGAEVVNRTGVTLQIAVPVPAPGAPSRALVRLLRGGAEVGRWENASHATHIVPAGEAGVFRVEVHLPYQGRLRGWIFANPIYVRAR